MEGEGIEEQKCNKNGRVKGEGGGEKEELQKRSIKNIDDHKITIFIFWHTRDGETKERIKGVREKERGVGRGWGRKKERERERDK